MPDNPPAAKTPPADGVPDSPPVTAREPAPDALDRSRDAAGRPRNARGRDDMGRPLPPGVPGVERIPDDYVLPPREALAEAQRLIDSGRPFNAHEVLEGSWKAAPLGERAIWRALAQLAVGLTHLQRGNVVGAVTLLRRGAGGLEPAAGTAPYDIAVDRLRADAATLADSAEQGRPAAAALRLT